MAKITPTGMSNQTNASAVQSAQGSATQQQNSLGSQAQGSQFTQIIQQVAELKQSLHSFVDQEDFPDANVISASGVLEGHLNHYYQLAVQKENQKPGLETL